MRRHLVLRGRVLAAVTRARARALAAPVILAAALLGITCDARAAPTISSVVFTGDASQPYVGVLGAGFGSKPVATNPGYQGYTGDDFGNALYLCDTSANPATFCAGQNNGGGGDTIGLVLTAYSEYFIQFSLGSDYSQSYYPANTFRLQDGDHFTITVAGASCSGTVAYNGQSIACNSGSSCPAASAAPTASPPAMAAATTIPQRAAGRSSTPVASLTRHHRSRHAPAERVFVRGPDEIAVAPGKSLASAYYHFKIVASHPFPKTDPQVTLEPITIDSRNRRVFLSFSSAGGSCKLVLTGTFPRTPIKLSANRRSFHLNLNVKLTNLVGGSPAGALAFHLRGRMRARTATAKSASSGGGSGGSGGLSLSLSSALDVYAHVLDAAGDSSKLASATATLPAVEQGSGDQPSSGSLLAAGSSYKGSTGDGTAISIELTHDKSGIKKVDVSYPEYTCDKPFASIPPGDESLNMLGVVAPDGTWLAFGEETLVFAISHEPAGFTVLSISGRFTPAHIAHGLTFQSATGTYTVTNYGMLGIAAGATCIHTSTFTANIVVTSG